MTEGITREHRKKGRQLQLITQQGGKMAIKSQTWSIVFIALMMLVTLNQSASASELPEPEIVRVEEDWVAYIQNPDFASGAPQIANVISPTRSTESAFGIVELNHGSAPNFKSGGYQVQSWIGGTNHDYAFSQETNVLRTDYDKLEYTVAMERTESALKFILKDGKSRTWGRFARTGISAMTPAFNVTLKDYDPQFSVDNTTINVGAHRVELMFQKEVRYYTAEGLQRTDTTPRVLHRFKEVVQFVSLSEYEQNSDYFNIEITE